MVDISFLVLTIILLWIFLGGLYALFGSYNWKLQTSLPEEILVYPFFICIIIIYRTIEVVFIIVDWVIYRYYRLTSYTKNYMKRRK